jgi:hypothetical protein
MIMKAMTKGAYFALPMKLMALPPIATISLLKIPMCCSKMKVKIMPIATGVVM